MRLVLNDFEAEAVKIIYNMYSEGHSYGQIITELSNRGFKTKAGKAFGKNSLYEILRQEKYTGTYVFNRRSRGANGKYNNHKESSDIIRIENGCPQIIDKRMWFKVQDKLKGNKKIGGQNKAKVEYLLSGKIFCGNCGSAMVGHTTSDSKTKKKYHYYVCANKKRTGKCSLKGVGKDKIEELVLDNLYAGVFSDSVIEKSIDKILDYSNKKQVTLPGLLEEYKANLKTIDADINKIIDLLMSGYRNESFKQKLDELEDAKLDLKTIITKTELQINTYAYNRNDVSNFMYNFKNFRDMDFKNQRKVINMFVYKVIIFDDRYDMKLFTNPMMSDIASPRVLDTGGHSSPRPV